MSRPHEMHDTEAAQESANGRHQQDSLQLGVRNMEDQTLPSSSPWQQEQNGPSLDAVEDK